MDTESGGYVTEIEYIRGFYPNAAPIAIDLVAAVNAVQPPNQSRPEGFRYLELGCGMGRVTTTLAAAYPGSEFVGVDFNAAHIAAVQKDIHNGRLTNAKAICASFAELPEDLGEFDYIVAHGVLSWVTPAVQKTLLDAAYRHLKPGGLFLVSYNVMAGWAPLLPIREMLLQYSRKRDTPMLEKITDALAYLEHLANNDAEYFNDVPMAKQHIATLKQQNKRYLVHEYLNENWSPLYFQEAAEKCEQAGLEYVGSLPLLTNKWQLTVPTKLHELFATAADRKTLEVHKDFATATKFRWDVYGKNSVRMTSWDEKFAALDTVFLGTNHPNTPFPITANVAGKNVVLGHHFYGPINSTLQQRTSNLTEIAAAHGWTTDEQKYELLTAVEMGLLTGLYNANTASFETTEKPIDTAKTYRLPNEFNSHVLNTEVFSGSNICFASAATGTAHVVSEVYAGLVWLLVRGGFENLVERADAEMQRRGRHLYSGGKQVDHPKARTVVLTGMVDNFVKKIVPYLVAVGVLEVE